jgi:hypothetical protein
MAAASTRRMAPFRGHQCLMGHVLGMSPMMGSRESAPWSLVGMLQHLTPRGAARQCRSVVSSRSVFRTLLGRKLLRFIA